mgnify:CR=1 FL=1
MHARLSYIWMLRRLFLPRLDGVMRRYAIRSYHDWWVGYGRARGYGRKEIVRFIPTIGARIVHVYQFEDL